MLARTPPNRHRPFRENLRRIGSPGPPRDGVDGPNPQNEGRLRFPFPRTDATESANDGGTASSAPKGHPHTSPGQSGARRRKPRSAALGQRDPPFGSPERATQKRRSLFRPFRASDPMERLPRAAAMLARLALPCPGLICLGPFGAIRRSWRLQAIARSVKQNDTKRDGKRSLSSFWQFALPRLNSPSVWFGHDHNFVRC
jgi:hypothetical protein